MLRSLVPNVALGTDIIVGFPTETKEDFMETHHLLKQLEFSVAFLFSYSPRKGTPAMRWKNDVPEDIKEDRLKRLITLQEGIYAEHRQSMLDNEVEVLVEKHSIKDSALLCGRTRCWKNVVFSGPESLIGTLQLVKIHSYSHQTLSGDLIKLS